MLLQFPEKMKEAVGKAAYLEDETAQVFVRRAILQRLIAMKERLQKTAYVPPFQWN